jgi:adenosylcobinamide kinase / adenosylcobinamide-phosphate guanylyltransferase
LNGSGITLLIGGARSGKSAIAITIARTWSGPVTFIATAEGRDDEMRGRIEHHRAERDASWNTVEEPLALEKALAGAPATDLIVVDCLTLWVSNLLERGFDQHAIEAIASDATAAANARRTPTIVVTNEVGSGIVPADPETRLYRDMLGTVNAAFAAGARNVLFVAAGRVLPMLRPEGWLPDDLDR